MKKNTINKDTVPQGFTMTLALVDGLPVLFFSIAFILLGDMLKNTLFLFAAILVLLAGALKVLWKIIVVTAKKNIWPLFVQMRIVMPLGFVLMVVSLMIQPSDATFAEIMGWIIGSGAWIYFILSVIGMTAMIVFAAKLDSSDPKSNWIEQLTNAFAQLMFLIGILLVRNIL